MKKTTIIGEIKVDMKYTRKKGMSWLELMAYKMIKPFLKAAREMEKYEKAIKSMNEKINIVADNKEIMKSWDDIIKDLEEYIQPRGKREYINYYKISQEAKQIFNEYRPMKYLDDWALYGDMVIRKWKSQDREKEMGSKLFSRTFIAGSNHGTIINREYTTIEGWIKEDEIKGKKNILSIVDEGAFERRILENSYYTQNPHFVNVHHGPSIPPRPLLKIEVIGDVKHANKIMTEAIKKSNPILIKEHKPKHNDALISKLYGKWYYDLIGKMILDKGVKYEEKTKPETNGRRYMRRRRMRNELCTNPRNIFRKSRRGTISNMGYDKKIMSISPSRQQSRCASQQSFRRPVARRIPRKIRR